jgi:hypothetical protein
MSKDFSDTKADGNDSYNVVFRTLVGLSEGVMTRISFKGQNAFEQWYSGNMRDGSDKPLCEVYAVVAKGVSNTEAARITSLPENTEAIVTSRGREARLYLGRAAQSLAALGNG